MADKISKLLFPLRVLRFVSHFNHNRPIIFVIELNVERVGIIMDDWEREKINSPLVHHWCQYTDRLGEQGH